MQEKEQKNIRYQPTSFHLNEVDGEQLEFLAKAYGCNRSAVIRRLIAEAYALLKYVKHKT